ncbi:MAG: hypothetical protein ACR2PY_02925, partial [Salinispira sp.]
YLLVPIKPGRNIPIIIETAAMNERLKKIGYNSVRNFKQNNGGLLNTGKRAQRIMADWN